VAYPIASARFASLRAPLWVRSDVCRRYARLHLGKLRDVDFRTETFSCSICGADGAMALEEPCKDSGMEDYRLDQRVDPQHHRFKTALINWRIAFQPRTKFLQRITLTRPSGHPSSSAIRLKPARSYIPGAWKS
jgi:hypothetical protein